MIDLDRSFDLIQELVDAFRQNEAYFNSTPYNEVSARKDFIDKFWIALGWDVNHDEQRNPYEQEVKVERPVSIGGTQRRADYAFHLAPDYHDVRFFVEAKKPHAEIGTRENYFQLIRYAWSGGTPVAVLTDFQTLHIVDCRYKPDMEIAAARCLAKYHYTDYLDRDKLAEIYWLFSREAVAAGAIERRVSELPKPRGRTVQRGLFPGGYQRIDEAFLAELDEYRKALAQDFKSKNSSLDGEALTELAQRTLDRLVFLRFLEDKGIEPERVVEQLAEAGTAWEGFVSASRRLDAIYNGIIYKRHDILDSPEFRVDEALFAGICDSLAHVNSPYDFNAIPIHILGSIYERFLGSVIVTTGKRAKVEEKLAVRKAGGVFYTPEYIVRYIVGQTVGRLIAGRTPNQIADMRFADIACGSGSFLIGVFDLLLKHHGTYYNNNPGKAHRGDCVERDGKLYLSLQKKRGILLNNIYGVDIDPQAVEVCQLSLYLRLLQDETEATAKQYLLDFARRALLPPLGSNIICGNSLVDSDVLDSYLVTNEEERKLNPMSFQVAFPEVMARGGFDAIVGNPPYVRIQTLQEEDPVAAEYLAGHFSSAGTGNFDIYVAFVERGLDVLRTNGRLGFIMPQKFWQVQYGAALRELVSTGRHLEAVVNFTTNRVFRDAFVNTSVMIFSKTPSKSFRYTEIPPLPRSASLAAALQAAPQSTLPCTQVTGAPWVLKSSHTMGVLEKMTQAGEPLERCTTRLFQGLKTGGDKIYVLRLVEAGKGLIKGYSRQLGKNVVVERDLCHELIKGTEMRPFTPLPAERVVIFPYLDGGKRMALIDERILEKTFPKTHAYFRACEAPLRKREGGKMDTAQWYGYTRTQALDVMPLPKLITPDLAPQSSFLVDASGGKFFLGGAAGGYGILVNPDLDPLFVVGLLNSRALSFFVTSSGQQVESGYYSFEARFIRSAPIARTALANKAQQDVVVRKVKEILGVQRELADARTDRNKSYYLARYRTLANQLNAAVYDLYELTADDIQTIEKTSFGSR